MMQLVCEGNFCDNGLHAVIANVLEGVRPLSTLTRVLNGRCSHDGEHSPACVEHFHHKCFVVPLELARHAVKQWCTRDIGDRDNAIDELLREGDRGLHIATSISPDLFAKHHLDNLTRACESGLACSVFVDILHLVPRRTALSAPICVHTIEDAHAAAEIKTYRRWLLTKQGSKTQRWATKIIEITYKCCASLPRETIDIILFYVFE
jgi:hypothetical protein